MTRRPQAADGVFGGLLEGCRFGNSPSGYSIIKADGIDAAAELAKGCPVFLGGATIDVVETFAVM